MRRLSLRNRWVSHVGCVALGAALAAGAWAGVGAWQDGDLRDRVSGRWTLDAANADPAVERVNAEYRPDGTFEVRLSRKDGSTEVFEHGRWWVSGGRLVQEHDVVEGRPVPSGTPKRPERLTVARADQTLVLVWPAGQSLPFRRPAG